jgi:hypothetical protein
MKFLFLCIPVFSSEGFFSITFIIDRFAKSAGTFCLIIFNSIVPESSFSLNEVWRLILKNERSLRFDFSSFLRVKLSTLNLRLTYNILHYFIYRKSQLFLTPSGKLYTTPKITLRPSKLFTLAALGVLFSLVTSQKTHTQTQVTSVTVSPTTGCVQERTVAL